MGTDLETHADVSDDVNPPERPPRRPTEPTPDWRWRSLGWLMVAALMWGAVAYFNLDPRVRTLSYSEFRTALDEGRVVACDVGPQEIQGELRPKPSGPAASKAAGEAKPAPADEAKPATPSEAKPATEHFRTVRVEDPELLADLRRAGVEVRGTTPSVLPQLIGWLLPVGLIVLFWFYMFRRVGMGGAGGAAMSFGKSPGRLVAEESVGVSFRDVAGCDEAKQELSEVVGFLRHPERFTGLGARIPKGVLLVGPPGTGKTLLARAVAGEAGVPFYSLSGSDFVEMFVGVGAARVRDLFQEAKRNAPCIVFIDELDAIGRARGVRVGNVNDEREHTLNQLLVEMDGFEPNAGVIILSATNRPDVLDVALLRPGRFDRQVVLDAPDVEGRQAILKVHARGKPLAADVDLGVVARATPGFSGADLANTMNEAALAAARRGASEISAADLEGAVEKVVAGPERKSRRLDSAEKQRIAYHEAGHAVVASYCAEADPVHKISIVPRGKAALGYTLQLPTGDQHLLTRTALLDRIRGMLGGRAAEELVLGEVSTGSENDLEMATQLARSVVGRFGMGETQRLLHCGTSQAQTEAASWLGPFAPRDCSERTASLLDDEAEALLEQLYAEAHRLLSEHRDELERVAKALIERETLEEADFRALLGPSAAPVGRRH
jgi:cell division protease FtsH